MLKLDCYLAKNFISKFLLILFSIMTLVFLIDFIEYSKKIGKYSDYLEILKLSFYNQFILVGDFVPFVILIAGILFFYKFSNNCNITILSNSGMSYRRIFLPIIVVIFLISLLQLFVVNHFADKYNSKSQLIIKKIKNSGQINNVNKNIWLSQKDYILNSEVLTINNSVAKLKRVKLLFFHSNKIIWAKNAVIKNNILFLYEVKIRKENNLFVEKQKEIAIIFDKEKFITKIPANHTSLIKLFKKVKKAKKTQLPYKQDQVKLHYNIAKPLLYIIFFLLSGYFCIYAPRYQKKTISILIVIITSFTLFVIFNILYNLALLNVINIIFAIWLPMLLTFNIICFYLLKKT